MIEFEVTLRLDKSVTVRYYLTRLTGTHQPSGRINGIAHQPMCTLLIIDLTSDHQPCVYAGMHG